MLKISNNWGISMKWDTEFSDISAYSENIKGCYKNQNP